MTMSFEDTGTWRDLHVGVNPAYGDPEAAKADLGDGFIPGAPVDTRIDTPTLPWWEGLEDPSSPIGLEFVQSPNPTYPDESVGAEALPGAYEGAYRTHGPVVAWGYEPSGGWSGDQAYGRIMRFPANIPERYDANGVKVIDYRDELAASLLANGGPVISDAEVSTNLIQWPNVGSY